MKKQIDRNSTSFDRVTLRHGAASENTDEYELCVVCGRKTNIRRDTHIDQRDCYVEGCGQICRDCYKSIYK